MPVACKPKHDYQGLLVSGGWVDGGCRLVYSCAWRSNSVQSISSTARGYVRAIEGRQEITFKSWHTEP